KKLHQIHRIAEISVVEEHSDAVHVRICVEMINARSVKGARAANDPVDFVVVLEQQISEITPVLASDAGDERFFHERRLALKQNPCEKETKQNHDHENRERNYNQRCQVFREIHVSGGVTMIRAKTAR